jgi:hypothetical protein
VLAGLGEGLAWTWRQPLLPYSAFFAAAVNVLLQVLALGLIVLARHEGASSAEIGVIVGCMGADGLAGAFAAPWLQRRVPAGITITACTWIWAVLLVLIELVRVPLWRAPWSPPSASWAAAATALAPVRGAGRGDRPRPPAPAQAPGCPACREPPGAPAPA